MLKDPRLPDTLLHSCQNDFRGGGDNQPPPSYAWSGLLTADIFQDHLKEWIPKALILALGEAILFFGRCWHKEGLPFGSAQNIRFSLTGSVNWPGRLAQVEATVNTVQEGCWAIADAVLEKKMKARGPGHPLGMGKAAQSSVDVCKVDDLMQGLDKGVSNGEVRMSNSHAHCIIGQGR